MQELADNVTNAEAVDPVEAAVLVAAKAALAEASLSFKKKVEAYMNAKMREAKANPIGRLTDAINRLVEVQKRQLDVMLFQVSHTGFTMAIANSFD